MRGAMLAVTVLLVVTGCGGGDEPPAGPKLTVGIRFDQPGLGTRDPDGGYAGFDVDVAEYVAERLGADKRNVTFVEARPTERENMLEQQKADMVVATYSITADRKQRVDFAGPYFVAGQSLLVRKTNSDIDGPESLNDSDWRLCSVAGSTPARQVQASYAQSVTLDQRDSYPECIAALLNGDIDAVTTDDVILAGYAAQYPDKLKVVGKPFSTERYGIGLRKGDGRRAKVTDALRAMLADGSWDRFVRENLGGYQAAIRPEIVDSP
ncbi:glutamate ABC transporter substrate-binding protein [Kibdelosporangium philippinense]|uniref:Glutamate ABC transporter substrate-binding protein n=1 Tax=Kibdelosporangium philippinense TaxID=211113 RepID=A0ABS8ZAW8_9PSEU|nr:glutamate ABC transporter substrate-binding protein [Kibdelosporangium philippinense]MCE7004955.1 glutamate ABC transporter substrate-binding protein [Kibdelosporangium philippinense]